MNYAKALSRSLEGGAAQTAPLFPFLINKLPFSREFLAVKYEALCQSLGEEMFFQIHFEK